MYPSSRLPSNREMDIPEKDQHRATQMEELEHLLWGKAGRAGSVQHGGKKALEDSTNAYNYLNGGCKKGRARLFPWVTSDRTRCNVDNKLKHRRSHLNTKKDCLYYVLCIWFSQAVIHNVAEVWMHLWRASGPSPQTEQGHLQLFDQDCPGRVWEPPGMETLQSPWVTCWKSNT